MAKERMLQVENKSELLRVLHAWEEEALFPPHLL